MRDVTYVTKDAGKVLFSHKQHMQRKRMAGNCKACHDGLFSIRKKTRATMADMAKGRSCGACHDGAKAFALAECARCHLTKDITYRVKATGPTLFSHKQHLAATPDCGACHPALFAAGRNKPSTMADMHKGRSCGACHNGTRAFELERCAKCHPTREVTFKVKDLDDVVFSHTRHTGLYTCKDCHVKLFSTARKTRPVSMGAMNKGASCGACHDGKTAFSVSGNCDTCHTS
jgi:c(7)-type cytochrome triheme protein